MTQIPALLNTAVDPDLLAVMSATSVADYSALKVPGVLSNSFSIELTNAAYHGDKSAISCSKLKALLRSPAHFQAAINGPAKASTSPQNLGTAIHTAVLEPQLFQSSVVLWKGGKRIGKEWEAFKDAHKGKVILNQDEMDSVLGMQHSILNYRMSNGAVLGDLLAKGEAEKSIFWEDEETGILCKIRVDNLFLPNVILDLKTVGDCRPHAFLRNQALSHDYDMQAAMYTAGVYAFSGMELPFCFISAEVDAPHAVWLHETGAGCEFYENGQRKFRHALRTLKKCRESGRWPSYEDAYTVLDNIPPYLRFEAP